MNDITQRRRNCGFGVVGWLLFIPGVIVAVLLISVGYYEGRKAYWDAKVEEMCRKDGGVKVYERVKISGKESELLWGKAGLPLPTVSTRTELPYFWEQADTTLRNANPNIVRAQTMVKRRSDGKVLGVSVQYWRSGGDLPTGISEATSFICPKHVALSSRVFIIGEGND